MNKPIEPKDLLTTAEALEEASSARRLIIIPGGLARILAGHLRETAEVLLEERGSAAQIFEACIQAARYAGEEGDAETADDILERITLIKQNWHSRNGHATQKDRRS